MLIHLLQLLLWLKYVRLHPGMVLSTRGLCDSYCVMLVQVRVAMKTRSIDGSNVRCKLFTLVKILLA